MQPLLSTKCPVQRGADPDDKQCRSIHTSDVIEDQIEPHAINHDETQLSSKNATGQR